MGQIPMSPPISAEQNPSPKLLNETLPLSPFDIHSNFFDLAALEDDPFASMLPFWPDPLLATPVPGPFISESNDRSRIAFDDFDRSRLIHDLQDVPNHLKGQLPSAFHLTTLIRQYFTHVNPLLPFIHMPSFSVQSCPTIYLVLLLVIGDVYSAEKTGEIWARQTFRYLMRAEIHRHENEGQMMDITSIQALNMWVSELTYSAEPSTM